jgi:hypothetical protein
LKYTACFELCAPYACTLLECNGLGVETGEYLGSRERTEAAESTTIFRDICDLEREARQRGRGPGNKKDPATNKRKKMERIQKKREGEGEGEREGEEERERERERERSYLVNFLILTDLFTKPGSRL